MNLEGKILGYDKKIVFNVVYTLVIIAIAFVVGVKYEKNKIASLEAQKALKQEVKQNKAAKKNKTNKTNEVRQGISDPQAPASANEGGVVDSDPDGVKTAPAPTPAK